MNLNKEMVIKIVHSINILLMVCFSPIMLFVFLFALSDVVDRSNFTSPLVIEAFGYLLVVVFGLLALKKRHLLFISLLGWVLLWWGNYMDIDNAQKGEQFACVTMRQDPLCVERDDGTMECSGGTLAGVYPQVCNGISK